MTWLDPLLPLEEYYDYRGEVGASDDAPPLWLPHNQGDVFVDVALPGIEQQHGNYAMLFQHPCTMRAGAKLKPRVVMLKVTRVSSRLRDDPAYWERKYSQAPLPGLLAPDVTSFAGDFLNIATVDSARLGRANRVATLSAEGRLQFQQRIIFYLTRFCPTAEELAEATSAVEAEISLQGSWVERAVLHADDESEQVIEEAESAFDEYMSEEQRRQRLAEVAEQHKVNAEVHREIDERYPAPN